MIKECSKSFVLATILSLIASVPFGPKRILDSECKHSLKSVWLSPFQFAREESISEAERGVYHLERCELFERDLDKLDHLLLLRELVVAQTHFPSLLCHGRHSCAVDGEARRLGVSVNREDCAANVGVVDRDVGSNMK